MDPLKDPLMERGMEDPPLPKYELAVTWYELILSPEKFHLHLKKLNEDDSGESCCKVRMIWSIFY